MKNILLLVSLVLMATAGYGDVAPNGTFNYSIPIDIPKGTNGMEPKLALSFSSVSDNGLMGTGWSFSGLATISRVSDGRGIRYDGKDSYVSPHGRILRTDPDDPMSHYLAENHNLVRYYPVGQCGDGPCSWLVRHPDGSRQYFGNSDDSRIEARLENPKRSGEGNVRVWALNQQEDRYGNFFSVNYNEYPATGDYYPASITYTQGNGLTAFKTIEFGYGQKPSDGPLERPDHWAKYQLNSLVHQRYLLRWISIKIDGKLLKRYRMTYDTSEFSRISRLRSVEIVGSDDTTISSPHRFTWQDKPLKVDFVRQEDIPGLQDATYDPDISQIHTGDFNGDGKTDFLKTDVVQDFWLVKGRDREGFDFQKIEGKNYDQDATLIVGDYDGDGITDLLKMYQNNTHWVAYGSPTGEFTYKEPFDAARYAGVKYLTAGDFNGDGRMDIFKFCGEGEPTWIAYGNADQTFTVKENVLENGCALWDDNSKVFNGDYNMDGRSDLVVISPTGDHFGVFSTEDGFRVDTAVPGLETLAYVPRTDQLESGDFNGDGIIDILNLNTQGDHWLVLSRGDGSFGRATSLGGLEDKVFAKDTGSVVVGDINGDSLADMFQMDSRGDYNWGVIANGDGTFSEIPITGIDGRFDPDWEVRIGDVTGKNKSDFVFFLPTGKSQIAYEPTKVQDALIEIQEPRGKRIAIDYLHTPQFEELIRPGSDDCSVGIASLRIDSQGFGPRVARASGRAVCGVTDTSIRYIVSKVQTFSGRKSQNRSERNSPFAPPLPIMGYTDHGMPYDSVHSYAYKNARFFPGTIKEYAQLGFETMIEVDANTGIKTVTTFHQDKPLQGNPAQIQKFAGNGKLKYQEDIQYQVIRPIATNSDIFTIKPKAKVVTTYEQTAADLTASGSIETHKFEYDAVGYLTTETVCTGEAATYHSQCKVINRAYLQDFEQGLQGQLSSHQTINADGQIQKWQRFNYQGSTLKSSEQLYCLDSADCSATSGTWQKVREILEQDDFGNVTKEGNIRGDIVTREFDGKYRSLVVVETNSLGHRSETRYDALARPHIKIGVNGHQTTFGYDPLGRLIELTKPTGAKVLTQYLNIGDPDRQRRVEVQHDGNRAIRVKEQFFDGYDTNYQTVIYDTANPDRKIYQSHSNVWQNGQRILKESAKHFADEQPLYETKTYDRYDRLIKVVAKDGTETTTRFEPGGFTIISPKGTSQVLVDAYGNISKRILADGRSLSYSYNANQKLATVTTSTGKVTQFRYDNEGRKTTLIDPTLGTVKYRYSPAGDLIEQVDNKGIATKMDYDVLGRITRKQIGSQDPIIYSYDKGTKNSTGRLAKVSGSFGYKDMSYTASGQVATTAYSYENMGVSYTESLTYDALDRVTRYTFPDGTTQSYSYDGLDQFETISVDDALLVRYSAYDANGRVGVKDVFNGFREGVTDRFTKDAFTYDPAQDVMTAVTTLASKDQKQLQNIRYEYNSAAELTAITDLRATTTMKNTKGKMVDTSVSQTYTYDPLGQLTQAVGLYGDKSYSYDQDGNITQLRGQTFDELTYNAKNQIASSKTIGTRYDANGNLVAKEDKKAKILWEYTYNDEGRLVKVAKNGTVVAEYGYNEQGRRYKKTIFTDEKSITTWYFNSSFEIVTNGANGNKVVHRHYHGIDQRRIATETVTTGAGIATIVAPDHSLWAAQLTPYSLGYLSHSAQAWGQWFSRSLTLESVLAVLALLFLALLLWNGRTLDSRRWLKLAGHTVLAYCVAAGTTAYGAALDHRGEVTSQQQIFYHYNYLGSATVLTDSNGNHLKRYFYSPYGEVDADRSVGNGSSNIRYGGYQADDETGLLYANARYYDPSIGRFLTPDPTVPKDGADYLGLNRYAYVKNNPIKFTDPSGYGWWDSVKKAVSGAGKAIGKAVSSGVKAISNGIKRAGGHLTKLKDKVLAAGTKFLNRNKKALFTWVARQATSAVHAFVTAHSGPVAGSIAAGAFSGFVNGAGNTLLDGGSFKEAMKVGFSKGSKALPASSVLTAIAGPFAPFIANGIKNPPKNIGDVLKLGVNTLVQVGSDQTKVLFKSVADTMKETSFIQGLNHYLPKLGLGDALVDKGNNWANGVADSAIRRLGRWTNKQIDSVFAGGQNAFAPPQSVFTANGSLGKRIFGIFDRSDISRIPFNLTPIIRNPLMSYMSRVLGRGPGLFNPRGGCVLPMPNIVRNFPKIRFGF